MEIVAWRYEAQGRWIYVDKNPNLWQDLPEGEVQALCVHKTTVSSSEEKNGAMLDDQQSKATK